MSLAELIQSGDWKAEKHSPALKILGQKNNHIEVEISIGKEIPHPNTTEHHISWVEVYFRPEGEKFPSQIGRIEFNSHGSSAQGPNTSTIYTVPEVKLVFKAEKSGILSALSYCNIHGLWQSEMEIKI